MSARLLLGLLLLAAAGHAGAVPTIPLQSGVPTPLTLPGGAFTTSYYFDASASDTRLRIDLQSANGADVDVYLRYGTPFPDSIDGAAPEAAYLIELAHYYAASFEASETIDIGNNNWQPVRAGRWFIVVLNFAGTPTPATLTATASSAALGPVPIQIVYTDTSDGCGVAGWNDPAPRAAVGGNPGTTLGAQRRAAIEEAARLLGNEVRSPVPIRVQACWNALGGDATSAPLAGAGPQWIFRNTDVPDVLTTVGGQSFEFPSNNPWLARNYTWFAGPPGVFQAGTRFCGVVPTACSATDIRIEFNTDVDGPTVLGDRGFYYGFSLESCTQGTCNSDFVSTSMHELTHGLGFISFVNTRSEAGPIGAKLEGYDDAYAANISSVAGEPGSYTVTPFLAGNDAAANAARTTTMTSISGLRWNGAEAIASPLNVNVNQPAPDNFIRLYAPSTITPGSTLSHLTSQPQSNALMCFSTSACGTVPQRQLGIVLPMLHGVGWGTAPKAAPSFQLPRSTQYFDPRRPGHGIDVSRVADNVYFVVFYTYGAAGEPEWYIAIGQVIDGVFVPANNANGDSLVRYKYFPGQNPPQQADASVEGQIRLDFNESGNSPACQDGIARDTSSPLAVMTWSIGTARNQQWCMQALIPNSARGDPDYTGSWFAGNADAGWGFSFLSFAAGATDGLFALLYYPDVAGNGRWAYVQTSDLVNGTTYTLRERRGYCRTCPVPAEVLAGQFNDVDAGTIRFTINAASQDPGAGNRTTYSVQYQTAPNGAFQRTDSPLILLSAPPQ